MGSHSYGGSGYATGTRVQHRNGYIYVKTKDGLMAEARRVWENHHGELEDGYRVFHRDGDRTNNEISNLAPVKFNTIKFKMLKRSRILFEPSIKVIDKKTGKVLVNS